MPKLCPNIRFTHQQDFFPIRSVTKSSTSRFSHENLVEKIKIFGQDFVPIRTALISTQNSTSRSTRGKGMAESFSREKLGTHHRKKGDLYTLVCSYVASNSALFADGDTTSAVRQQGEELHGETYGMRNRPRNVYFSHEV